MRRSVRTRAAWLALCLAGAGLAAPLDPTILHTIDLGAPAGAAPLQRVDGARSGRSRWPLPARPRAVWQTRIAGPLAFGIAVDDRGHTLAVTGAAELIQLDAKGRQQWSARTPAAISASAPFVLAGGSRGFVTRAGEVLTFTREGRPATRTRLLAGGAFALPSEQSPSPGAARALGPPAASGAPVLVRSDGNLIVGLGEELFQLGQGDLQHRARLSDRASALLEVGNATLITTARGTVLEWWPPAPPRALGQFGGEVDGGAAWFDSGKLVGIVDQAQVVLFDLRRRTRTLGFSDPAMSLQGPPALVRPGAIRFLSRDGVLMAQSSAGGEALRTPLDSPARAGDPAAPTGADAALLVDARGRTAVARRAQALVVVHPDGHFETATGADCAEPLALAPVAAERLVMACRDGLVQLFGP
jgi:hypothetical protein